VVLNALRGGVGFLSRIPIGNDESAWKAFSETPVVFPIVGYLLGAVLAVPLTAPIPAVSAAAIFVFSVYLLTGITHLDGVADLGDAVAAHGAAVDRREIMQDSAVGTGGVLAVALVVFALGTAGVQLAAMPTKAVSIVVVAEVGAKLTVGMLVCLGSGSHEGLGSALTSNATALSAVPVTVVGIPALVLTWPYPVVGAVTLTASVLSGLVVLLWARRYLGGVSGDVFGATNEIARVVAVHAGVIAWTLS
jgi:adenosylcobinamide-GDP ribazoletransferase